MAIFHSYVSLPEGIPTWPKLEEVGVTFWWHLSRRVLLSVSYGSYGWKHVNTWWLDDIMARNDTKMIRWSWPLLKPCNVTLSSSMVGHKSRPCCWRVKIIRMPNKLSRSYPGWWFGTMEFYDFPYIGNVIIPTDCIYDIFQRGRFLPPSSITVSLQLWSDRGVCERSSQCWCPRIYPSIGYGLLLGKLT